MSIRWGIITAGLIASDFVNALKNTPKSTVVACAARSLDSAKQFCKVHGIPNAYGSYDELVKDKNVDIVYIGSLHKDHYEQTMLALNHGKHVLVEKPAGINSTELNAMYKLAAEKNLFLMEGVWTLFFPAFRKIQSLIAEGAIGEVTYIQVDFQVAFPSHIERIWTHELAGGAILDIGIYPICITTMLINGGKERPVEIKATGVIEKGVDTIGTVTLKYRDGKIGVASWNGKGKSPGEILVVGSKGWIRALGQFHHPRDVVVHRIIDGGKHLLDATTETTTYHFPFPSENTLDCKFNYSGSIGFQYEATSAQNDILNGKRVSSVYPPIASLTVMSILDESRRQMGLVYSFEKSKL